MRNKNLWIILAVVVLIAVVMVIASQVDRSPQSISDQQLPITTNVPATATDFPADVADAPEAYLLVTVGGVTYQPLPLQDEGEFSITQGETGMVNTVHVTRDSIRMAASTCDNQDCVDQGVVTLESMNTRVLGNMIICLPHQVTLELYTAEEMDALLASFEEAAQ